MYNPLYSIIQVLYSLGVIQCYIQDHNMQGSQLHLLKVLIQHAKAYTMYTRLSMQSIQVGYTATPQAVHDQHDRGNRKNKVFINGFVLLAT